MVALFRDVMGLRVEFAEPLTTELSAVNGDRVQVFAPAHPYFQLFSEQATGPVALFEVDDVSAARAELADAGIELIGSVERDSQWEWVIFRAPDGNLYGLTSRPSALA